MQSLLGTRDAVGAMAGSDHVIISSALSVQGLRMDWEICGRSVHSEKLTNQWR